MSQKKVCVIMGYGLAIGQVALEALIESGYSVAIVARNLERLKATEDKYSAEGHIVKGCKKIHMYMMANLTYLVFSFPLPLLVLHKMQPMAVQNEWWRMIREVLTDGA